MILFLLDILEGLILSLLKHMDLVLTLRHFQPVLHNVKFAAVIVKSLHLLCDIFHLSVLPADDFQLLDLFPGILDLLPHAPVLHDALLHILNMDILLHADIFLHKLFQFDIHAERDGPLKQKGKLFRVQPSKVYVVQLFAEPLIVGAEIVSFFLKIPHKPQLHFLCGHGPAKRRPAIILMISRCPVLVVRYGAFVPEEHSGNLIGGRLHIKHHADALTLSCVSPPKLQHDSGREIAVPQIGKIIVLPDIDHSPQVLNQVPVRIISRRLVKKSPAVGVGVEDDLHGVNDRGLSAAGMAGEKIDPFMERQRFMSYIVPVVQAYSGQRLKPLIRHLPHPLPYKSRSAPSRHPPSAPHSP